MENLLRVDDVRERLEDLENQRDGLGQPEERELKSYAEPISYIIDTLENERFFDPLHALELYGGTDEAGDSEFQPLDEILEGKTFKMRQLRDSNTVLRRGRPFTVTDRINGKMENAREVYRERDLQNTNFSWLFDQWYEKCFEATVDVGILSNVELSNRSQGLELFEGPKPSKSSGEILNDLKKDLDKPEARRRAKKLNEPIFSRDELTNQDEYRGVEVKFPEPEKQLAYEMARYFLQEYEGEIERIKANTSSPEKQVKKCYKGRHRSIDWDSFRQKYGSLPDESMRDLYETVAKFRNDTGLELDTDLMGKIVADANGAQVNYKDDVTAANRNPSTEVTLGDVKNSIKQVEGLNYKLPVGSKERRLHEIVDTVENIAQLETEREYEVVRTK